MSKIENDQFYTKQNVADRCFIMLKDSYPELLEGASLLEPSAGTGSFLRAFEKNGWKNSIFAFDIDPKSPEIEKKDFLSVTLNEKNLVAVGNPPFGKRSHLAMDFFNHCASMCHTIAFIVPVQFRKYGVQRHLDERFHLVYDELLDPVSFENGTRDLTVRCCFQIWTAKEGYTDLRIGESPAVSHRDFTMYLYNNTPKTLKYFDYSWDFAVPRQGFYDYSQRIKKREDLNPRIQYMFFKGNSPEITDRLKHLDYGAMSLKNTTIRGFGKADVVKEYTEKYGK